MEKLYNDKGQVAVAVSYGYGAGWSTWNTTNKELCLDKTFNELILAKKFRQAEALAEELDYCGLGINKCQIKWLEVGTKFYISECDGFEELITVNDSIFIEA